MADELQCNEGRCFVSAKLDPSLPEANTRIIQLDAVPLRWTKLDSSIGPNGFLSSWLQADTQEPGEEPRIHWAAICGIGISFVISAGFWAGVGLLISRLV